MTERRYYSVRTGRHRSDVTLDLPMLKRLFLGLFTEIEDEGWFQEALGFECVDSAPTYGSLGRDIEGEVLLALRKENIWPIRQFLDNYSEDDLFDVIEFLYDQVSKPTKR